MIIRARNFKIDHKNVLDIINNLGIKYLRLFLTKDYDNKIVISVKMIDPGIQDYTSSFCSKIFFKKSCYIYTPELLRKYVGKNVLCYQDMSVFRDKEELFKITPIGFNFDNNIPKEKIYVPYVPYFTELGILILPKNYIYDYFDNKIMIYKISFDITDSLIMNTGVIYAYFHPNTEKHYTSFKLKNTSNGLSTGVPEKLISLSKFCKKKLRNFKYHSIKFNEEYKYGMITFKEN
jgi:hypothetical protein